MKKSLVLGNQERKGKGRERERGREKEGGKERGRKKRGRVKGKGMWKRERYGKEKLKYKKGPKNPHLSYLF